MKKLTEQKGYVLLWVLFLLSVTMLWGSLLLLNTSDQYEVSNGRVREEQSQLLARSGWNLALQQLETTGGLEPVVLETRLGSVQATVKQDNAGFYSWPWQVLWRSAAFCWKGSCSWPRFPGRRYSNGLLWKRIGPGTNRAAF